MNDLVIIKCYLNVVWIVVLLFDLILVFEVMLDGVYIGRSVLVWLIFFFWVGVILLLGVLIWFLMYWVMLIVYL